jgi:GntR family transcriptional regulator
MMTYTDCERNANRREQLLGKTRAAQPVLSRSSPEPLYRQLASHLEGEILGGRLKPGDRLASEGSLTNRFGVSRITLRQAVAVLVRKRLVVRKQGKGTFVTAPSVRHDLRRSHGLLGSLFSQAQGASARLLRYELQVPPVETATLLNLGPQAPALRLDRLYLIGGKPVALAEAWLVSEVGALSRTTAKLMSTEDMMRQVGIAVAASEVTMRAEAAGAAVGRALNISARAAVLVLRRRTFGDDGAVKEVCRVRFCSDAYEFVCSAGAAAGAGTLFDIRNVGSGFDMPAVRSGGQEQGGPEMQSTGDEQ